MFSLYACHGPLLQASPRMCACVRACMSRYENTDSRRAVNQETTWSSNFREMRLGVAVVRNA